MNETWIYKFECRFCGQHTEVTCVPSTEIQSFNCPGCGRFISFREETYEEKKARWAYEDWLKVARIRFERDGCW